MKRTGLLAVLAALLLTGCGSQSDEQQIRDELVVYTRELADGNFADACRRVTNPLDCITSLRASEILAGGREELLVAIGLTDEVADAAHDAKVTLHGDHATVDNPATKEPGIEARRTDDGWQLVFPKD